MELQTQHAFSALSCLVNNEAAVKAAERLAQQAQAGLRFCCESGEKLTVAEGRKRDEADAARKARFQQSMAALEARLLAAESQETESSSDGNEGVADDDDDFAEFETDNETDFPTAFELDDDTEEDSDELLEIELV